MPTGGGKSITFQVPALAMDGICLVVTPLIALMKDQVDNLRGKGIRAAAVYSGMPKQEILLALDNCILGDYKFLYISPERLGTELFVTKLKQMKVCMIAVDESHCISQWGYDFRPSYLRIADIRELLPGIPVLALTATATPEVVKEKKICSLHPQITPVLPEKILLTLSGKQTIKPGRCLKFCKLFRERPLFMSGTGKRQKRLPVYCKQKEFQPGIITQDWPTTVKTGSKQRGNRASAA